MAERLAIDGGTPVFAEPLAFARGAALLGDEERAAVLEVLESRSLFRYYGPALLHRTAAFERDLAATVGAAHAVAVSSGTAALRTALAALGVGCGDEVVVPAFTFVATVNAVVAAGAVPVFAEVDASLGLDPEALAEAFSERTVAVLPVHLENVACRIDAIVDAARRRGVAVVEDAAQSLGATYDGRSLGGFGDIGCFSFQLEKNVTSGEGGALVTSDDRLALRAARYQDQGGQFVTAHGSGRGGDLDEPFSGENLRMTELAAAIAGVQLGRLPHLVEVMRSRQRRILDAVGDVPGLVPRVRHDPEGDAGSSITWFAPTAEQARRFVEAVRAEGVPAVRMYDGLPVYATPAVLQQRTASGKGGPWNCAEHPPRVVPRMGACPGTEALAARAVTVGVGVAYDDAACDDVATAVHKVAAAVIR